MPAKVDGPGATPREIDRFESGVGWIAHPAERMQRASHALVAGEEVWVVDPVDAAGLDDLLAEFGRVAGVVVLFNWHTRDAEAIAARHGVAVHVPTWINRVADRLAVPIERFEGELDDTGFHARKIAPHPLWREAALYRAADGTLVVPDSVGTAPYFRAPGERLGVSPYQRLWPPKRVLGGLDPQRVLVGHGPGVSDAPGAALADALTGARQRAPAVVASHMGTLLRNLAAAFRQ